MPSLITDTIEEKLGVLIIGSPSQLTTAVVDIFNTEEFSVQHSTPAEFTQQFSTLVSTEWYRTILIVESINFNEMREWWGSLTPSQSDFFSRSRVLFPLSSHVSSQDSLTAQWQFVVEMEKRFFIDLSEKINKNNFLLYENIVGSTVQPLLFSTQLVKKGYLLDPQIEINLLTLDGLREVIQQWVFQRHQKMMVVRGRGKQSAWYCSLLQDLYQRYFQQALIIRPSRVVGAPHPIITTHEYAVSEHGEDVTIREFLSAFVKTLPLIKKDLKDRTSNTLEMPDKTTQMRVWNTVVAKPQRLDIATPDIGETETIEIEEEEKTVEAIQEPQKEEVNEYAIDEVFTTHRQQQRDSHLSQLITETKRGSVKIKRHKALFIGGLGIIGVGFGLVSLILLLSIQSAQLRRRFISYLDSRTQPITAQEKKLTSLSSTNKWVSSQLNLFTTTLSLPFFPETTTLSSVVTHLVQSSEQQRVVVGDTTTVYAQIMGTKTGESLTTLTQLHVSIDRFMKELSLLVASLKEVSDETFSPQQKDELQAFEQDMVQRQQAVTKFNQLYPLLPSLLGDESRKTYAVVLENEQELRPTGGFIQAVAFITFQNGQLMAVQVQDVYQLDQQLPVFVEPPNEIRQFLGEERWFIRDSNWNPDYPQSAERMRFLLEKSTNQSIYGVITLNIHTLKEILGVLEQVQVPEYNEVLTARNIAERMEFYSEIQLVNQEEKPEYSELVLQKIMSELQNLPDEKVVPLLSTLERAANEKELLVYVAKPEEQATFASLGWSGSIVDPTCPTLFTTESCLPDSLFQVEANVGVNKANYYLQRQVDHSIQVSSTQVNHKRVVTFKNTAQSNAWPKGPYRAYTRFYVHPNAVLDQVVVDGVPLQSAQITTSSESGRLVWGVLTETPVQKETVIELSYSLPHSSSTPFTYVFFDQKQPGAREISPRIFMNYDPQFSPTLIAPQADVQGNVIVFNPSKDTGHMFVGASFK